MNGHRHKPGATKGKSRVMPLPVQSSLNQSYYRRKHWLLSRIFSAIITALRGQRSCADGAKGGFPLWEPDFHLPLLLPAKRQRAKALSLNQHRVMCKAIALL